MDAVTTQKLCPKSILQTNAPILPPILFECPWVHLRVELILLYKSLKL